jgi:hypothetical protein
MKKYERLLLNNLVGDSTNDSGTLQNLKNSLGSVKYVKGNPLTKTEITINCTKNYNLRNPQPVFLFGLTDYYSGYAKSLETVKPAQGWTCINGQGEILGAEMAANWVNPAFWTTFGGDWSQQADAFGVLFLQDVGLVGGQGSLRKTNFWQVGHTYRIKYTILNAPYDPVNYFTGFGDALINNNVRYRVNHSQFNVEYDYTPLTTDIRVIADLFPCSLYNLSVKEVTGYKNFIGEPPIGIYGFNKNICFSTDVAKGDLIITYAANNYPSPIIYTCEVILHCGNVAYGTFLNSFVSDLITLNTVRYIISVANVDQFDNALTFFYQTLLGKLNVESLNPNTYNTNTEFQNQICDIPLNLPIDKNMTMLIPMNFDCEYFDLVLFVENVTPLTNN